MRKFSYTNGAKAAPFLTYTLLLSHLIHAGGDHRSDSEFTRVAIISMPRTRKPMHFMVYFLSPACTPFVIAAKESIAIDDEVSACSARVVRATPTLQQARHALSNSPLPDTHERSGANRMTRDQPTTRKDVNE